MKKSYNFKIGNSYRKLDISKIVKVPKKKNLVIGIQDTIFKKGIGLFFAILAAVAVGVITAKINSTIMD